MGKTWVLHTETKGTGAQMVPLERARRQPSAVEPVFVPRKTERRDEPKETPPRAPHRFRIVDVMTRQTLADGVGTREAVAVLSGVRSIVDVNIYVWQHELERWRPLTFSEQRRLIELAGTARG